MNRFELLLYNIYSLLICLRYFPIRIAITRPLLIHPSVRIRRLHKGDILLMTPDARLVIGFEATEGQSNCTSMISIRQGAHLKIHGFTTMAQGTRLIIEQGEVEIGKHFFCNGDCYIRCTTRIIIGDDNMYGWKVNFNTSNGHRVFQNGIEKKMEDDIKIGNHVWIGSGCDISKGVEIADECIVAQYSNVIKSHRIPHTLIAGSPAKDLYPNYSWRG